MSTRGAHLVQGDRGFTTGGGLLGRMVAPAFAALPDRERPPPAAPAFLHTSAPARGLGVLLDAWPAIRGRSLCRDA